MRIFTHLTASLLLMSSSFAALATDLPQIHKPAELEAGEFAEGTLTTLNTQEIGDYIPWANNAKKLLQDALTDSKRLRLEEKVEFLKNEIKSVVRESSPKKYQMLMRFALNRGLLLADIVERETEYKDPGMILNEIAILKTAIKTSFEFYESDLEFQKKVSEGKGTVVVPQADLGLMLAQRMLKISPEIFDASAQYQFMKKTFEMLNWDLSQDADSKKYAEQIVDIYKFTSKMPANAKNDEEAIKHVRSLYYLMQKVNLPIKAEVATIQRQSCGESGTIEERMMDCSTMSDSKKGNFVLVTKTKDSKEIYKDMKSGLIWGDRLPNKMDHFEAEKACNDQLAEVGGIKASWRLPTKEEFEEAEKNGVISSLPNMKNRWFWSSSVHSNYSNDAWLFNGNNGSTVGGYRSNNYSVRCVAR